jgi:type IV secretory pathway TraG/TraD family ATPase VirD4
VLFMLDEAYKGLGKMESLFDAMAAVASAGGRLAFVYQDVLQIEKLYGRAWESFAAQSSATLFFAVNDMTAAEYISRRCGDKTTRLPGNPTGVGERLIRPEAVLNMPKDEILGLFRSARPAKFKRLNVLTDPRYKSKLAYNSTYDEPEEREYTARDAYVPVDLDAVDLAGAGRDDDDDIDTEELIFLAKLAKKYNRHVFVNESGHYGYKDERGMFIRVDK